MVRDLMFGGVEHHTWSYLRGEGNFSVDGAANSITDLVYRGMAVNSAAGDDRLDRVVERLESIALTLGPNGSDARPTSEKRGKSAPSSRRWTRAS
ncbi:MAG: hypothetical protein PVSMB1_17550 [Gemmatimonadaceae bacterium]